MKKVNLIPVLVFLLISISCKKEVVKVDTKTQSESSIKYAKGFDIINDNVEGHKVVFPMHPRTKKMYDQLGMNYDNLLITGPMSYLEFIFMIKNAKGVITDSGGITEETTVLKVPCMTLRNSTERPETITIGTNELVGTNPENIKPFLEKLLAGTWKSGGVPELWDGQTADRIIKIIATL